MSKRVLVMGGGEPPCSVLVELLRVSGYEVQHATKSNEGYDLAINSPPDAMVLDTDFLGRGSFDICRALKRKHATATRVLILSNNVADAQYAKMMGADDFARADISTEDLAIKVATLLI